MAERGIFEGIRFVSNQADQQKPADAGGTTVQVGPNESIKRGQIKLTNATRLPVVALQILQQRDALFEPLQILGHGAAFASGVEVRRKAALFPGEDGGAAGAF